MPVKTTSIRVFDYTDYRKYLLDYYQEQKTRRPAFSYRFFARRAGINSVGLYRDIVQGRQSLGRALILKFSAAIGHNKKEAEYFENMVYFCEARSVEERKAFFERMMACCDSRAVLIDATKFEYYSKWYYSAVRSLLSIMPCDGDPARLASLLNPAIQPAQATKAIEVLERLGLIRKDNAGRYDLTDASITTGRLSLDAKVQAMQVINFQRVMTDLGTEAYDRHPTEAIDMSTLTLGVSRETVAAMKEEIAAFRKKLARMAEDDQHPDRVYQLNYQFFPLSTAIAGEGA